MQTEKKINLELIKGYILIYYPFLNLLFCFINNGNNMNIFSAIFSIIIIGLSIKKKFFTKENFVIIFILLITLIINLCRDNNIQSNTFCVEYIICTLLFLIFAKSNINELSDFLQKNKKHYIVMQMLFFLLLILHCKINGFTAGWNTYVLKGPYLYPHTLAYLLLFIMLINSFLFLKEKKIIYILLNLVCLIGILLTAVRSALLVSIIIMFFSLKKEMKKHIKMVMIISVVIAIIAIILYKFGVFESVIQKTKLAISSGSITSGRGKIILSSLGALNNENTIFNVLFGVGMSKLQAANLITFNSPIHAHNDLIDILVSYGIFNLIVFVRSFYLYGKEKIIWIALTIGLLILGNGFFCYIDVLPIIAYPLILFKTDVIENKTTCGDSNGKEN